MQSMKNVKQHVFLVLALAAGSALVLAQSGSQDRRAGTPGHPDWKGQTLQTSPPPANAEVGGLDPMDIIRKPLADQWTSYSGDMSGKRFSQLKQVNTNTVKNLSLKWVSGLTTGCGPTGRPPVAAGGGGFGGGRGGGGAPAAPINVGGLGNGDANNCGPARLGGGILSVDGVIYASSPSNVYAIDARDGTVLWHYYWKTRGGTSLQTRGLGMWRNYIYFELNDDWVVCLDAKTGKEIWKHEIAPFDQQYFSSNAPMVIKDHVLVGTGNDLDAPAFLKSLDPRTGAVQWILYSTPQNPGEPGLDTWASLDAARHGNGATWIPGSYDPETNLYIYGTGNPTPAYTQGRGEGDNLFTSSLLAVDVDTGKIKWYFQTSPHDTHDWDSTQTPILVDMPFNGRMRKLVMTATRNGYFFVLDRTNGQHLLTTQDGPREQLGGRPRRQGTAEAQSQQGRDDCRVARERRRPELPAADLLSRHRPVLRARAELDAHQLPDGAGSARVDGPRRHHGGRQSLLGHLHRRPRLQDRQGHLAEGAERRQRRTAVDGGRPAVPEQRSQRRSVGCGHRQGPLVFADRRAVESGRDLHARRQAAPALHRRQRAALPVRLELASGGSDPCLTRV